MEVKSTKQLTPVPNGNIGSKSKISEKGNLDGAAKLNKPSIGKKDGYSVAVSSEAQLLKASHQKAFDIAKNTSSMRTEKMAEIKAKIKDGSYKIDSGKIADGMLREAIKDELSTSL
jgi:negative regulator of flagellin synthesis FlgM